MARDFWDEASRRAQEDQRRRSAAYEARKQREAAANRPKAAIDERLARKKQTGRPTAARTGMARSAGSGGVGRTLYDRAMAQKAARRAERTGRTQATPPPPAPTPAAPEVDPTTRQPLDRSTRVGAGDGITGFASAAEQLQRLRNLRDTEEPARETVNRGFQYQPSQWAQQVAARNARITSTQRVRDPKTGKMVDVFDRDQYEAIAATDPRMQGLARSKQFQDTRTEDLAAATRQRAQDIGFRTRQREARGAEEMARTRAEAGIAQQQIAGEYDLAGEEVRGRYGLEAEQLRADADMSKAQLKARIDQAGLGAEQAQQNFENIQGLVRQYSMMPGEEGQEVVNYQRERELNNFLTNSGITDTRNAQAAVTMYDQFATALQRAGEEADSNHPAFARLFGWFKANKGRAVNYEQLKGEMSRVVNDANFRRAFRSDDSRRAFIESLNFD